MAEIMDICISLSIFSPGRVKSLLHLLDFDEYLHLPSYRSTGFKRDNLGWLIAADDFPELSYLNLDVAVKHIQSAGHKRISRHTMPRQEECLRNAKNNFISAINELFIFYLRDRMRANPKSARVVRTLLWLLKMTNFWKYRTFGRSLFNHVLETLYIHHNDSDLVRDLLTTYHRSVDVHVGFRSWTISVEHLEYICEKSYDTQFDMEWFLKQTLLPPFCPVLDSILDGEASYLKMFIKYGFKLERRDTSYLQYASENLINCISKETIIVPFRQERNLPYTDQRQYLQLLMLIISINFITEKINIFKERWLDCGYFLFSSIPDPYISWNEIRAFFPENKALLEMVSDEHKEHLSEIISEVYEPRTLEHLCRCVIRSSLRKNIPNGIDRLTVPSGNSIYAIPTKIIKYLRIF